MASSFPHPAAVSAVVAANAAAATAIGSSPSSSAPGSSHLPTEQANNLRLMAVYDRISLYFNGGTRFDTSDVMRLCYSLAKAIDCSLTLNDIPGIANCLPQLVKKVYDWRNHASLQPAIMMVLISVKNACKRGWFRTKDSEEFLRMADELCSKYCTELCPNTPVSHSFDTISKLMLRFYPRMKLCSLIISFEAKVGYDVMMSDFHYPKNHHEEQKIVLIVVKMENLETSSCITTPPQVSFLVNGQGVEKRNNVSLDHGPQFPTDISRMLKYGINILQTIGYFDGTYLIAVAYVSKVSTSTPVLKEYVQPVVEALESDTEIIEGPSRIQLSCPISFKRMKNPVKGHLCKHHQCFDYDNFLEMNSRKPNWRCPHCNQPVCVTDLRIDRNMVEILEKASENVAEVVIHADGSWNVVAEHDVTQIHNQAYNMECDTNRSKASMANPVDLTMEEDDSGDITRKAGQEVLIDGYGSQNDNHVLETEDRKPFIDTGGIQVPHFVSNPPPTNSNAAQVAAYQHGNNMQSTFMTSYAANGSLTSAVSPHMPNMALPVPLQTHVTSRRVHANVSPRQYLTINPSTTLESFNGGLGNMDMQQITRTAADTSGIQDHAQQSPQYVLNEGSLQHAVGLSSTSTLNGRSPAGHRRGPSDLDSTYRASIQSSPFSRHSLQTPPGFRTLHSMNQPPTSSLPPGARQAPQNAFGLSSGNFGNHRGQTQPLPSHYMRSPPTSPANSLPSRDNTRVLGTDRWRSMTGGVPSPLSRPDSIPDHLSEQNWRPTGRMRGSLSGSDYSAVISHYMAPSNQSTATTRAPMPSLAPSTSDQVSAMIANNLMAHGAGNHQVNFSQDNLGTQ